MDITSTANENGRWINKEGPKDAYDDSNDHKSLIGHLSYMH